MIDIYLFVAIVILLAWMDYICFQRPHDSGYFSLHTKGSKRDAWHDAKKLVLGLVAFSMLELDTLLEMLFGILEVMMNPYVLFAAIAYLGQRIFYNFLFKKLK